MKSLILSTIFISSIAGNKNNGILSERQAKSHLKISKEDKGMYNKCGKNACTFEEWGEKAENYEADGWDSESVRSPEKEYLFAKMYTQCVGDATGKSKLAIKKRFNCVTDLKEMINCRRLDCYTSLLGDVSDMFRYGTIFSQTILSTKYDMLGSSTFTYKEDDHLSLVIVNSTNNAYEHFKMAEFGEDLQLVRPYIAHAKSKELQVKKFGITRKYFENFVNEVKVWTIKSISQIYEAVKNIQRAIESENKALQFRYEYYKTLELPDSVGKQNSLKDLEEAFDYMLSEMNNYLSKIPSVLKELKSLNADMLVLSKERWIKMEKLKKQTVRQLNKLGVKKHDRNQILFSTQKIIDISKEFDAQLNDLDKTFKQSIDEWISTVSNYDIDGEEDKNLKTGVGLVVLSKFYQGIYKYMWKLPKYPKGLYDENASVKQNVKKFEIYLKKKNNKKTKKNKVDLFS